MKNSGQQIFRIRKIMRQKKWSAEEDSLLLKVVKSYKERNWKEISKYFKSKDPLQCFSRYKRIRPGLNRGPWTKDEDKQILKLIHCYGSNWAKISKAMGSRNGKQIRDRYINVLDPLTNKNKFSTKEDELLISLFKKHGCKWATISKYMDHRTPDMVKNRFHSCLKKRLEIESDYVKTGDVSKYIIYLFFNSKKKYFA